MINLWLIYFVNLVKEKNTINKNLIILIFHCVLCSEVGDSVR